MDLSLVAQQLRWNSERWFPELHDGHVDLGPFYALALAGEVGEVCNLIKKTVRYMNTTVPGNLASEIADVFTYLMLLANEYQVDVMEALHAKQAVCEERWGKR